MKRLLILLSLFIFFASNAQFIGVYKLPNAAESCTSPTVRGQFYIDNFNGTSLGADWTVSNPGSQTITVSGGRCRIVGGLSTKNVSLLLKNTNTLWSTLRNYTITVGFKFMSIGSTTFGPFVGVEAHANDANLASSWANVDPANVDSVEILQTDNLQRVGNTARTSTGLPSINTSDDYTLALNEYEDTITATLTNVTAGTSASVKYGWNTISSSPRRPNLFEYCMGVAGGSDISFDYFAVSTTESLNANGIFIGNSIEVGYSATSFTLGFPYKLRAHTSCLWQVMAGAGLGSGDGYLNRAEIITMNPKYVISGYGTNDGGGNQTTYRLLIDALEAAGIQCYVLSVVNGGDPFTIGTYNYSLRVTYFPSEFVNIWTTGQSQMSVANGLMQDVLHPNTAGHAFLAAPVIKTQLPALFPN